MSFVVSTLKALALRGAAGQFISISTRELGRGLGVSQQTASNRLMAMADSELIRRRRGVRGQDIMITKEGLAVLRREFGDYQRIFGETGNLTITGTVASGLGEGQYYLTREGYKTQLKNELGFEPFEGTLNLKVTENELAKLSMVPQSMVIRIDSFQADGRTFGEAECIPVTIQDIKCAIIRPRRSHHDGVLEIISAVHLRNKLKLEDGAGVVLHIDLG